MNLDQVNVIDAEFKRVATLLKREASDALDQFGALYETHEAFLRSGSASKTCDRYVSALLRAIGYPNDTWLDTARLTAITICNKVAEYATDSRRTAKEQLDLDGAWYDTHPWVKRLKAALPADSRRTFTVREDIIPVFHEAPPNRHEGKSVTLKDEERGPLEQGPCRLKYNILVATWEHRDKSGRVIGRGAARHKLERVHMSPNWAQLPSGRWERIEVIERARQAQRK